MPFDIPAPPPGDPTWPYALYKLLKDAGVTQFSYVPDAGHRVLIDLSLADPDVHSIPLTSEEEGVAMAAGANLGGEKHVLLMQSSGAGNCINMLSLPRLGKFPFLTILSMRGDFGEGNPWQIPMGRAVKPVFEAMGGSCLVAERAEDVVAAAEAAMTMVFQMEPGFSRLLAGERLSQTTCSTLHTGPEFAFRVARSLLGSNEHRIDDDRILGAITFGVVGIVHSDVNRAVRRTG